MEKTLLKIPTLKHSSALYFAQKTFEEASPSGSPEAYQLQLQEQCGLLGGHKFSPSVTVNRGSSARRAWAFHQEQHRDESARR